MKIDFFKIILCLFFIPLTTQAQFQDNFSDGNFTQNPQWKGDTSKFAINPQQQLQLNGLTKTDTTALFLPSTRVSNAEWRFWFKPTFAPSSSNYIKVYLVADTNGLKGSVNGYYIRIGAGGSTDAVDLYRQTGSTSTKIISGIAGRVAKSNRASQIKVTRDPIGTWNIYCDTLGGSNYELQGTTIDITHSSTNYFGLVCRHTSTNRTKFYFDDFYIGQAVVDSTPPVLDSISVIDKNTIIAHFSEEIALASAQINSNYTVGNGLGAPILAKRDSINLNQVKLTFINDFGDGILNTLSINNLKDIEENIIKPNSNGTFIYHAPYIPKQFDIVFNELLADPSPLIGLPNAEYIELYNRSGKTIDLLDWKLTDGSTIAKFKSHKFQSNSYLIICDMGDTALFKPFGNILGASSFPSINNEGDSLQLLSPDAQIIDAQNFSIDWYKDVTKKQGGWALERVDTDFLCENAENWQASTSTLGGTPGTENSVKGIFTDTKAPACIATSINNNTSITLTFSESLENSSANSINSYQINNGIGFPQSLSLNANKDKVTLTLANPLQEGIIYEISIGNYLKDCSGNNLGAPFSFQIGIPVEPDAAAIVINEILFNPKPGNVDFVELYNRSDKAFDLKSLQLSNGENTYSISNENRLFLPNSIVAISTNIGLICSAYECQDPQTMIQTSHIPSMNDDAGLIKIIYSNKEIDSFSYTEKMHFSLLSDVEGVSLERIDINAPTQKSDNWHSAASTVGYATPGYKNSQSNSENKAIEVVSLEQDVFTPNNDGKNDMLRFYYNVTIPGSMGNAMIYDTQGNIVKHFVKNELLAIQGSYAWDGINESNLLQSAGMYILYFQITEPQGNVRAYKKAFALVNKE